MHVLDIRNVNEALPKMLQHLEKKGERNSSRAGEVIVAPTPVTTVYRKPMERVGIDVQSRTYVCSFETRL